MESAKPFAAVSDAGVWARPDRSRRCAERREVEEESPVLATVSVHCGFESSRTGAARGLTIDPAMTAGVERRVGCLAPDEDADSPVASGDLIDPRDSIEGVFLERSRVCDSQRLDRSTDSDVVPTEQPERSTDFADVARSEVAVRKEPCR